MLKLYKRIDDKIYYWETWDRNWFSGIIHWGILGQHGKDKTVKSGLFKSFKKEVQKEIDNKLAEGYKQIEIDDHYTLLIEYSVDGMGTEKDLEKRHLLQNRMDETLGWTGLGYCDGGSIGSGTMEVCCFVVDFKIAKEVISNDLKDTEFADYTRIFDENKYRMHNKGAN